MPCDMAAEGQSGRMVSAGKQRCVTKLLHMDKKAPTDIHC